MSNQKDEKSKSTHSSEETDEQSVEQPVDDAADATDFLTEETPVSDTQAKPQNEDSESTEREENTERVESAEETSEKKPFQFERPIEELYDADAAEQAQTDAVETDEKQAPVKRRKWPRRLVYFGVLVLVSLAIALFIVSTFADCYGLGRPNKKIDVTIPHGATTETIANILKKDGVISNPLAFRLFVRQNKISGFQSGVYTVNPSHGYEAITDILRDPDQNKNQMTITIPEGQTVQQIADLLHQKGVCTQQDFRNALNAGGFTFSYNAQIPSDPNRLNKYEGYLFPDTYTLLKGSSGKIAIQKMLSNFSEKFTPAMVDQAKQQGMTVDQIVTLASIIQKEANSKSVMANVSSVFYNRLRTGVDGKKLLQSDATVLYAKRDLTAVLQSSDVALDSHYNTYRYEGLPPGPICNPGMDAINAALNPNSTNYFYFVSDKNGKYYFSSTYADHVKNVKKAAKAGTSQATGDLNSNS